MGNNEILRMLEETAARYPHKTAVADELTAYDFTRLVTLSRAVGEEVRAHITPGAAVGVFAKHEALTVPLLFGALYGGGFYVPLDPDAPPEKLHAILESGDIRFVIGSDREAPSLAGAAGTYFPIEEAALNGNPVCSPVPDDVPLCVIYTSGSTGVPKGVEKTADGMRCFLSAFLAEFPFSADTVLGNQTPFYFDAAAKDLYVMAACGARIEILPTRLFSFPVLLIRYLNERAVTAISWVPSALTLVTALNTFREEIPHTLQMVLFVGEVFAVKHLNRWRQALPDTMFVNLYGSTEICGICCFWRVSGETREDSPIPIGTPLSNCEVVLRDGDRLVTEAGQLGEICVASEALARGYYRDAVRTEESFVCFDGGHGSRRFYCTGDLATYDGEGRLVFASRRDYQIKHMGHRIELPEVEAAAMRQEDISDCAAVYDTRRQKIVLFVQPHCLASFDAATLRAALRTRLSDYMMPHRILPLSEIPKNQNGKTDRQALTAQLA